MRGSSLGAALHNRHGIIIIELLNPSIIQPNASSQLQGDQERQKSGHDQRVKDRDFAIDVFDSDFVKNFASLGSAWLPGIVLEARGEVPSSV